MIKFADKMASSPSIQEYQLEVQARSKHEHVSIQFDLCDGAGGKRVSYGDHAHVLVTPIKRRHVHRKTA